MRYLEDFEPGETLTLGTYEVTEAEVRRFGEAYDPQPFHLDDEAGRAFHFGGLVASGWHTAAIFQRLYVDGLLRDAAVEGSPGSDELRWIRPVRPGDVLTGVVTPLGAGPSLSRPDCGLVRKRCELRDAAGEVVFRMTLHVLFRRRPVAATASTGAPDDPRAVTHTS
ncbi:MAG: MaoC family dehydratase [Actinocatenispora sp.]